MNVKIQCVCGTKFAFDVEPVNGRMPVNVNCPGCNNSALELANAEIQRQLASSAAVAVAMPAPTPTPVPAPAPADSSPSGAVRIAIPSRPAPAAPATPAPVAVATVSVSPAPAPVRVPSAPSAPKPPQQNSLRISGGSAHAAPAAAPAPSPGANAPDEGGLCPKHKTEPAVETCRVCGKPICPKCMEQFGYVCSVYCRQQAEAKRIKIPVYAHQKTVVQFRTSAKTKRLVLAGFAFAAMLLGLWFWYAWFARDPKLVYSIPIVRSDSMLDKFSKPDDFYELIGPNQLLSVKDKQLALMDVMQKKQLWSVRLQTDAEEAAIKAARAKNEEALKRTAKNPNAEPLLDPLGFESDYLYSRPQVITTSNDIWLVLSDRMRRFDRQTGATKEIPVKDKIKSIERGEDTLLVVTEDLSGRQVLTQITFPDATTQTEEIVPARVKPQDLIAKPGVKTPGKPAATTAKPADRTAKALAKNTPPPSQQRTADSEDKLPANQLKNSAQDVANRAAAASAGNDDENGGDISGDIFLADRARYIPTGANAVQFTTKLIERNIISHEAMKPKGKSILESDHLTAGQSLDVAQEMMNDSQRERTGGKELEDVSRYQVTLHRRLAGNLPDWVGEVTGPPQFIPLKTVDVVAAGNSLLVFDKNNKKLWEAKLTYTIPHRSYFEEDYSPCLETKDALYVADKGILTRYDLSTGNPVWRMNSVGISRIQQDHTGQLYVNSTTATPDSIQYSQQINIMNKIHPVILKVDQKTGKVLWRLQSMGDDCRISGKFVYTTMVSQTVAWLKLEEGPDTHYNLYLISPSGGSPIWNYHVGNHHVIRTDIQNNWIMLHLDDEVRVLKFFSL